MNSGRTIMPGGNGFATPITFIRQKKRAELLFHRPASPLTCTGEDEGTERLIPFDSVPRIVLAGEWQDTAAYASG
ncbi:hypothetical protein MJ579_18135 [Klebsiella pneumoniae]|nr:hypothetical protein MJ579_18135 [Klebsiella pneumoniae]